MGFLTDICILVAGVLMPFLKGIKLRPIQARSKSLRGVSGSLVVFRVLLVNARGHPVVKALSKQLAIENFIKNMKKF